MIGEIKSALSRGFTNIRGYRSHRKIVVIESDDWGSIRMPNTATYESYKNLGYDIENCPYCRFDTLADADDLSALFEVLLRYQDSSGKNPKITFNTVTANPIFNRIRESGFNEYYYEPFTDTLKNYFPNQNVFNLWRQGIDQSLIKPQFHGREHVNVPIWLNQLKSGNQPLLDAFELGFWGIPPKLYKPLNINIQAAFDSADFKHIKFQKLNVIHGSNLFETIFGYRSKTFIANNYIFSESLCNTLLSQGIKGIQSMRYHKIPQVDGSKSLRTVYTGKMNLYDQVYFVRNCVFEPSQRPYYYSNVENCIKEISQAFFWKTPAIITSHRLNFIGSLVSDNRKRNLRLLDILLKTIIEKWPDVEFMSTNELLSEITELK